MPREGVFAVVREPGDVAVGDSIELVSIGDGTCDRSPADAVAESAEVHAANCEKVAKMVQRLDPGEE
jgi:hypothetical protein